ncbi:MAG TPA: hypothetical protein VFT74_15195 [Isosphaeraceae bacterium]|nr:hypothetical protein [Isosphaeraceae bacterium]
MVNVGPVLLALFVPIGAYRWGQRRRARGQAITLRDRWVIALCVWAVSWPVIALPQAYQSDIMTMHDKLMVTSIVLGISFGPLLLDSLIRIVVRTMRHLGLSRGPGSV